MKKNPIRLPFELDPKLDDSLITAYAGLPLVVEMFRSTGGAAETDRVLRHKKKFLGLTPSEMLESVFCLWASGGERCEDFENFRTDRALTALIGHRLPAPQTARDFFDSFHKDDLLPIWSGEKCSVPNESPRLEALTSVNRAIIDHVQTRKPTTEATIDLDAVILECDRSEAERTYEGTKGYQPVVAMWAEQDLVLADEYRDGNVPAGCGNARVVKKALEQLPQWVTTIRFRADSACYEEETMSLLEEKSVEYAISADMTRPLLEEILRLPESAWQTETDEGEALRQWAEVVYIGGCGKNLTKTSPCPDRRYLVIRIIKKQGYFFADGSDRRHHGLVTNRAGNGLEIIQWHRLKAGTIEHVHHVVVNELAGGKVSSKRFGAKAAWFRANTMLYNVLSALRHLTFPPELQTARPKRLRFLLFNTVGRVVRHAREMLMKMALENCQWMFDFSRLRIHLKPAT